MLASWAHRADAIGITISPNSVSHRCGICCVHRASFHLARGSRYSVIYRLKPGIDTTSCPLTAAVPGEYEQHRNSVLPIYSLCGECRRARNGNSLRHLVCTARETRLGWRTECRYRHSVYLLTN